MKVNILKIAWLFLASMLLVAAGVWMVFYNGAAGYTVDGIPVYWVGWASIVFFGMCAMLIPLQFLPGASYLHLASEGFTYCNAFRAHTVRWEDVQEFGVMRVQHNRFVGWNYTPDYQARAALRSFSKSIAGYEACLPDTYGLKVEKLAEVLETLRLQYGAAGILSSDIIDHKID